MSKRRFEWHGPSFVHGAVSAAAWAAWGPAWGVGAFLALPLLDWMSSAALATWRESWREERGK